MKWRKMVVTRAIMVKRETVRSCDSLTVSTKPGMVKRRRERIWRTRMKVQGM